MGKHIDEDIFSDEYLARIEKINLPNTKIKALQRLLAYAIDEFRKVNKIKSLKFNERMKAVVDMYNNRRRDEAFANEVLDGKPFMIFFSRYQRSMKLNMKKKK